ncbi:MAG: Unknown protein, partial [uncultured Thiotrichaceae bacterium]
MANNISRYKEIRQVGIELNTKIFETIDKADIRIAARVLGLVKGKKIVIDSESEMDRFTNFVINDYVSQDGKNLIEKYLERNSDSLTEDEKTLLDALLIAKPSLYRIVEVDKHNSSVKLTDIINKDIELTIIDIGFSQSVILDFILYTRVLCIDDIYMTSGAVMLFDGIDEKYLIEKSKLYAKKSFASSDATKRAAAFFKLYKKV